MLKSVLILLLASFWALASPCQAVGQAKSPAAPAAGEQAKDIPGYRTLRWGMTCDQVEDALKGEVIRCDPMVDVGEELFAFKAAKPVVVGNVEFKLGINIDKVTHLLKKVLVSKTEPLRSDFDLLEEALTSKYGPPSKKMDGEEEKYFTFVRIWVSRTTTVKLSYSFKEGVHWSRMLYVKYEPTRSVSTDNL